MGGLGLLLAIGGPYFILRSNGRQLLKAQMKTTADKVRQKLAKLGVSQKDIAKAIARARKESQLGESEPKAKTPRRRRPNASR